MLRVHSIETFGTHEGPGIRMVVFLQGCMFRCLYCHNPDTWQIGIGTEMSNREILERAEHIRPYFRSSGGITVSGGEPLVQRKDLISLFKEAQEKGIHTTLDTNGFFLDDDTKTLLKYTDLVLLDVKHIDPKLHLKLTHMTNKPVLDFAQYCRDIHKKMWLRYVLVPGYTNQTEFLHQWGKHFTQFENIERVEILPYHTFGVHKYETLNITYHLKDVKPPSPQEVHAAQKIFTNYFKTVYIR